MSLTPNDGYCRDGGEVGYEYWLHCSNYSFRRSTETKAAKGMVPGDVVATNVAAYCSIGS